MACALGYNEISAFFYTFHTSFKLIFIRFIRLTALTVRLLYSYESFSFKDDIYDTFRLCS